MSEDPKGYVVIMGELSPVDDEVVDKQVVAVFDNKAIADAHANDLTYREEEVEDTGLAWVEEHVLRSAP